MGERSDFEQDRARRLDRLVTELEAEFREARRESRPLVELIDALAGEQPDEGARRTLDAVFAVEGTRAAGPRERPISIRPAGMRG